MTLLVGDTCNTKIGLSCRIIVLYVDSPYEYAVTLTRQPSSARIIGDTASAVYVFHGRCVDPVVASRVFVRYVAAYSS
jgi:hypothetical protein